MVSSTKQTQRRRSMRQKTSGQRGKQQRAQHGTPAFPVHPENYDQAAPDAKPKNSEAG